MKLPTCLPLLTFALIASACAAHTAHDSAGRESTGTFHLVNASFDSVVALAIAPSGSDDYRVVDLGAPLPGGLSETYVRLPPGACLRDLRVTFRDGRALRLGPLDTCRVHALRLDPSQSASRR